MPTAFSVKPTRVGGRALLRPFTPADIDAMGPGSSSGGAALMFDGERVDEVLMAVLRPEWEQRRDGDARRPG